MKYYIEIDDIDLERFRVDNPCKGSHGNCILVLKDKNNMTIGFELKKEERNICDCLLLLKNIQDCGDCNVCANKKGCQYAPKWGQMVRYNCPFYKKAGEKNDT